MEEWLKEFYRCYPELQFLFVCKKCGWKGTVYAYGQGMVSKPLLGAEGKQLMDKNGNPRTVEIETKICKNCGGTEFTVKQREQQ